MNICMLTSFFFPTIGGVEAHVYNLAKCLKKRGHNVTIVHTSFDIVDNNKKEEVLFIDGIEVHRIYLGKANLSINLKFKCLSEINGYINGFIRKIRPIFFYKYISDYILKIDKEKNFDIIHQHDFISNIFTTKRLSKKFLVMLTNHTGEFLFLNKNKILKNLLRYLLNHYKYVIAPSKELSNIPFLKKINRVEYISNGVDTYKFSLVDEDDIIDLKRELTIEEGKFIVLCARRWAPTKGVIYLIKAIKKVINTGDDVIFVISGNNYYGYPEYRKMILSYIKENKLSKYIKLVGDIPHNEIKKYYQVSDVVVLPSLMEATSLAGLEAMSCGKPLIGSNIGGIPEIIDDNKTGYLVEVKNSEMISKKIIELKNNIDIRKEMGILARKKVEKEFSWEIVAKKTEKIYLKVLNEKNEKNIY